MKIQLKMKIRVVKALYSNFSDAQGQITPELVTGSSLNSNIQAFMVAFDICKTEEYPFKNEWTNVLFLLSDNDILQIFPCFLNLDKIFSFQN